jgi:copper chaperone CopZ
LVIKKALEGLEGVRKANISYSKKKGEVFFDPDKVTEQEIVNKVTQIGFKAKVSKK